MKTLNPNDDKQVFEALLNVQKTGQSCVLVILVDSRGSVPAGPGAKMVVTAEDNIIGTIGGGSMEQEAIKIARGVLAEGKPQVITFELNEEAGYACGGQVTLYIEPVFPAPRLILAGAGHVGQAVCSLAAYVGFSVTVADDRAEFASSDLLPEADHVIACNFESLFSSLPVDIQTLIVCATRGHTHDYTVVREALKTPSRYIGLLGSRRKRNAFFDNLRKDGFDDDALSRIHTPVGLEIGAKTPREIAVSIVSELIQIRRKNG